MQFPGPFFSLSVQKGKLSMVSRVCEPGPIVVRRREIGHFSSLFESTHSSHDRRLRSGEPLIHGLVIMAATPTFLQVIQELILHHIPLQFITPSLLWELWNLFLPLLSLPAAA